MLKLPQQKRGGFSTSGTLTTNLKGGWVMGLPGIILAGVVMFVVTLLAIISRTDREWNDKESWAFLFILPFGAFFIIWSGYGEVQPTPTWYWVTTRPLLLLSIFFFVCYCIKYTELDRLLIVGSIAVIAGLVYTFTVSIPIAKAEIAIENRVRIEQHVVEADRARAVSRAQQEQIDKNKMEAKVAQEQARVAAEKAAIVEEQQFKTLSRDFWLVRANKTTDKELHGKITGNSQLSGSQNAWGGGILIFGLGGGGGKSTGEIQGHATMDGTIENLTHQYLELKAENKKDNRRQIFIVPIGKVTEKLSNGGRDTVSFIPHRIHACLFDHAEKWVPNPKQAFLDLCLDEVIITVNQSKL